MTMELNGAFVVRISIARRIRSKENRKLSSDGGMTVLKWIPLARRRFRHRCVDIHNNAIKGNTPEHFDRFTRHNALCNYTPCMGTTQETVICRRLFPK